MKWESSFLSGLRGQLGKQIVGSVWKGRNYFRGYKVPANPNTNAQKAERAMMANIVQMFQQNIKGTPANKTAWNLEALPSLISGFNEFTKYGRGNVFGTVNLAAGSLSVEITDSMIPADRLAVMVYDLNTTTYLLPDTKRGLGTYTASDFTGYTAAAGDIIYIADTKVLVSPDTESDPALYKACSKWMSNQTAGTADELLVTS